MKPPRDLDSEFEAPQTDVRWPAGNSPSGRRTMTAFWIGAAGAVLWGAEWLTAWMGAGLTFGELTAGAAVYHIDSIVRILGIVLCSTAAALLGGAITAFAFHGFLHWFMPGPFNRS